MYYYFYSIGTGAIGISTFGPISAEKLEQLKRFRNVFEFAYRRYMDVAQAEAQARESQIELALERVRARTMAMQHSSELSETSALLFQQIQTLGVPPWSCGFNIWEQGDTHFTSYMGSPHGPILEGFKIPLTEEATFIHFQESRDRGDKLFVDVLEGERLEEHYRYFFTLPGIKEAFEKRAQVGDQRPTFQINHIANFSHGNLMFITYEPCEEAHDIFIRFAKVFEQTYIRFLDLQKAEAQAREAQIEAALERVRSRTMGMQKSEELKEVIQVVNEQFVHLQINVQHAGFLMDYKENEDMHIWLADPHKVPSELTIPYFDSPHWNSFMEAKEKGLDFFANQLDYEEKNRFYNDLLKLFPVPDEAREYYQTCPGLAISTVLLDNIGLYIENFSGIPYTDEENAILMRFGKVFEQAYIRFNDLKQAEMQAREAHIEVSLERVRSRSMAMHKSDELLEAGEIIFIEMQKLGIESLTAGLVLMDKEEKNGLNYAPSPSTQKNNAATCYHSA